jgi:bacterioferritin-associated ferredoxin
MTFNPAVAGTPTERTAMIVCLCKGVSSRTILDEARRGACTLKQIRQSCQAGTGCGACVQQIRQLLETVAPGTSTTPRRPATATTAELRLRFTIAAARTPPVSPRGPE